MSNLGPGTRSVGRPRGAAAALAVAAAVLSRAALGDVPRPPPCWGQDAGEPCEISHEQGRCQPAPACDERNSTPVYRATAGCMDCFPPPDPSLDRPAPRRTAAPPPDAGTSSPSAEKPPPVEPERDAVTRAPAAVALLVALSAAAFGLVRLRAAKRPRGAGP